jgi:pilus assembly protein Flp/PilA
LRALFADRRGATAVEYGLIASLIVLAMIGGLSAMGGGTGGMWGMISADVSEAMQGGAAAN